MIKIGKCKLKSILSRLHYLIKNNNGSIGFSKLGGGIAGYYYNKTDEIEIDYRRDIVATMIHEALHKWHKDWSETKVISYEVKIVNMLTQKQFKSIIKDMSRYIS